MLFSKDSSYISLQQQGISFKHKDRRSRYLALLDTLLSSNLHSSFPVIFKSQYDLKAFYRLINNKAINMETFIEGYQKGLQRYSESIDDKKFSALVGLSSHLRRCCVFYTNIEK